MIFSTTLFFVWNHMGHPFSNLKLLWWHQHHSLCTVYTKCGMIILPYKTTLCPVGINIIWEKTLWCFFMKKIIHFDRWLYWKGEESSILYMTTWNEDYCVVILFILFVYLKKQSKMIGQAGDVSNVAWYISSWWYFMFLFRGLFVEQINQLIIRLLHVFSFFTFIAVEVYQGNLYH